MKWFNILLCGGEHGEHSSSFYVMTDFETRIIMQCVAGKQSQDVPTCSSLSIMNLSLCVREHSLVSTQ